MASRRGIGAALSRGSETIHDMVQQMIRARIQEESQKRLFEQQDKLETIRNKNIADRQEQLATMQAGQRRDQYMLENPAAALPGPTRMAQGVGEGIDKADSLTKLPSRLGVATAMGGSQQPFPVPFGGVASIPGPTNRPEISQLLAQRQQKEEAIRAEIDRLRQEKEDATKRMQGGVEGVVLGGQFTPTERTGGEEGGRQAAIEKTTRPGVVARAGGVAAAGESGRIGAEFSNLDKIKAIEEAKAKARASGTGTGGGGRLAAAKEALDNFKMLSANINQFDGPQQIATGLKRLAASYGNLDNLMTEYQAVRGPLAQQLTVVIQGARPSDTDVLIQQGLLPDWKTPKTVARRLIAAAESVLNATGGQPDSISREELFQILKAAKDGTMEGPDSYEERLRALAGGGVKR